MFLKVMAKCFDNFETLAYSLLEEDFSKELANLFNEDADDIEDTPVPESVHEDPTSSVISFLISELECPVCYQPMLGHLRLPLICPNGHPCCSSCALRVRRICPTCRSSNTRWSKCLFLERMGSYMVEKGSGGWWSLHQSRMFGQWATYIWWKLMVTLHFTQTMSLFKFLLMLNIYCQLLHFTQFLFFWKV